MRTSILAVATILLSSSLGAQSVKMPAKDNRITILGTDSSKAPAKDDHSIKIFRVPPSPVVTSGSSSYNFDFTDPQTAPTMGGRWVRSEQLVINASGLVMAKFVFAQPGTAPIIAALQQQYGAPTINGNVASWTVNGKVVLVSANEDQPTMTISTPK